MPELTDKERYDLGYQDADEGVYDGKYSGDEEYQKGQDAWMEDQFDNGIVLNDKVSVINRVKNV